MNLWISFSQNKYMNRKNMNTIVTTVNLLIWKAVHLDKIKFLHAFRFFIQFLWWCNQQISHLQRATAKQIHVSTSRQMVWTGKKHIININWLMCGLRRKCGAEIIYDCGHFKINQQIQLQIWTVFCINCKSVSESIISHHSSVSCAYLCKKNKNKKTTT